MRKALFPIISTLSICFLFSGCWIKDVLEDLEDYESGVAEVDRALLYGAWQIDKAKFAADATMTAWDYSNTYMTFKENGIYEGEGYYGDVKGIYTIQGNVITVLIDNVNYVSYKVLAQSDESLTLRAAFTTTTTKVWMECKKAEYL